MSRRRRKGRPIHGWINLDKAAGMTSAHAVAIVKRLTGAAKVGHGGTLDPMAEGVLPIALGEATKLSAFIVDATKDYEFAIAWGEARDTDDAEGAVIATSDVRPTAEAIDAVLGEFIGTIAQVPPRFSAIKVDGRRAYDLAREGVDFTLEPRPVEVFEFRRLDGATRFFVRCGKGAYIRALARDLAARLGGHAYVSALTRTRVGALHKKDAISLATLEEMSDKAARDSAILPVTAALDDIPALAVTQGEALQLRSGRAVTHRGLPDGVRFATCQKVPVAMVACQDGQLHPVRVFNIKEKVRHDVDYC